MPWTSPDLERERRLHEAGRLAYDLGATDLVPLQLRLKLEGGDTLGEGGDRDHGVFGSEHSVTPGVLDVLREVLKSNPQAYAHGMEGHVRGEGQKSPNGTPSTHGEGGYHGPEEDDLFGVREVHEGAG